MPASTSLHDSDDGSPNGAADSSASARAGSSVPHEERADSQASSARSSLRPLSPDASSAHRPPKSQASKDDAQPRPKQKRNKPTLSCKECVERKTKCDRGRPTCEACVKRGSYCRYSEIAEILHNNPEKASKSRKAAKLKAEQSAQQQQQPGHALHHHQQQPPSSQQPQPPQPLHSAADRVSIASITNPDGISNSGPSATQRPHTAATPNLSLSIPTAYSWQPTVPGNRPSPPPSTLGPHTPVALSSLAVANAASINIFGRGIGHPFDNYWTATGGLAEVIGVLPTREQADILVAKYFEILDPLYPLIDRDDFINSYEQFWSLPHWERCEFNAAILALHLVVYASATQFIELAVPQNRQKTADFYISAAHQALRISSYWNHVTMATVQAMALTFYFLINDNHAPDAYTHTGMTVRQAYVLQLNRDPETTDPAMSPREKSLRLRVWQTVSHQDVGYTQFLKLPPAAIYTDITPECFDRYIEQDLTSASMMASDQLHSPTFGTGGSTQVTSRHLQIMQERIDLVFSKSLYVYTKFILEHICSRRALGQPICSSPQHKKQVIEQFRYLYASLHRPFGSYDPKRFHSHNKRLVRQQISLANNYFHSMMLVYADEDPASGVTMDVWGTLDAAHEALLAFFAMWEVFGQETNGFWAYQHRAFEVAIMLGNILTASKRPTPPSNMGNNLSHTHLILRTAKEDVARMLQIMGESRGYFVFQSVPESRYDVLKRLYDRIIMV